MRQRRPCRSAPAETVVQPGERKAAVLAELNRRNVPRAAAAYLALAWLLVQIAATVLPLFGFTGQAVRVIVTVLAIGFLPAMVAAWSFELTPEGLKREGDLVRGS